MFTYYIIKFEIFQNFEALEVIYLNNLYRTNINYIENRGGKPPHKSKISFKNIKDNTFRSLNEVEYFLNNFNHFLKYVKLYKILK